MISPTLNSAIVEHMKNEYFSSYLYRSIAAYYNRLGLLGFEAFFKSQSDEELSHADKFLEFLKESRADDTRLLPIEGPKDSFGGPLEAMEYTLKHEEFVTKSIQNLRLLAKEEDNQEVEVFLNWFIAEQIEEIDVVSTIIDRMRIAGGGLGVMMIDHDLADKYGAD